MAVPKVKPDGKKETPTKHQHEKPIGSGASTDEPRDPDQAWYWTKEWQDAEREAEEDDSEEQAKIFDTMEDLLADLNSDDD